MKTREMSAVDLEALGLEPSSAGRRSAWRAISQLELDVVHAAELELQPTGDRVESRDRRAAASVAPGYDDMRCRRSRSTANRRAATTRTRVPTKPVPPSRCTTVDVPVPDANRRDGRAVRGRSRRTARRDAKRLKTVARPRSTLEEVREAVVRRRSRAAAASTAPQPPLAANARREPTQPLTPVDVEVVRPSGCRGRTSRCRCPRSTSRSSRIAPSESGEIRGRRRRRTPRRRRAVAHRRPRATPSATPPRRAAGAAEPPSAKQPAPPPPTAARSAPPPPPAARTRRRPRRRRRRVRRAAVEPRREAAPANGAAQAVVRRDLRRRLPAHAAVPDAAGDPARGRVRRRVAGPRAGRAGARRRLRLRPPRDGARRARLPRRRPRPVDAAARARRRRSAPPRPHDQLRPRRHARARLRERSSTARTACSRRSATSTTRPTRRRCSNIARALKPGGKLLIEILNRDYVIADLPTRVWWEGDGCVVLEEVELNYFSSRIQVNRSVVFDDGRQLEQEISVRAYSLHEVGKLMHAAGFRVLEVSGGYQTRGPILRQPVAPHHCPSRAQGSRRRSCRRSSDSRGITCASPGVLSVRAKTFGPLARLCSALAQKDSSMAARQQARSTGIAPHRAASQACRTSSPKRAPKRARTDVERERCRVEADDEAPRSRRSAESAARERHVPLDVLPRHGARSTCCVRRRSSPPRARSSRSRSCCGRPCSRTRRRSTTCSTRSRAVPDYARPTEAEDAAQRRDGRDAKAFARRRHARGAQAARRRHRSSVHRRRARRDRSHDARHRRARRRRRHRSVARTKVTEWLRRVHAREPRRGRRAQRVRQGEPAPRRRRSRAASTTAACRSPT